MINIGPTKEGTIPPIFEERLRQVGQWLAVNGEAIYSSRPWKFQNDSANYDVWYTSNKDTIYGIVLKVPDNQKVLVSAPKALSSSTISLLGYKGTINWQVMPDSS